MQRKKRRKVGVNEWASLLYHTSYVTLSALSSATMQEKEKDNKTDLYVPPSVDPPFNIPQLYTTLHAIGPLITKFPIAVQALIDIGCPCTVIM